MASESRNAAAFRSAQQAYDNAEPPEPREGVPMRCAQCGHQFDQSEATPLEDTLGWMCPACGDNDTHEDEPREPEPDLPDPDDLIDEAMCWGGLDRP